MLFAINYRIKYKYWEIKVAKDYANFQASGTSHIHIMKFNFHCLLFPKIKQKQFFVQHNPSGSNPSSFQSPSVLLNTSGWLTCAKTGWENVLTINTSNSPGHNCAMALFCHDHPAHLPGTVLHQFKVILKTVQYFNFARAEDLYKSQIYIKIQDLYQSPLRIKSA